jgi:predicted nucleic acid-binding protein
MDMIVVDTSVLVDHLRNHPEATGRLDKAAEVGIGLCGSVVTKVELIWGMRAPEKRSVRALLDTLTWLPVTDAIAERAGRLARRYRASHSNVDLADYVIGATALESGAALWTRNVKHFPMFDDLQPPY